MFHSQGEFQLQYGCPQLLLAESGGDDPFREVPLPFLHHHNRLSKQWQLMLTTFLRDVPNHLVLLVRHSLLFWVIINEELNSIRSQLGNLRHAPARFHFHRHWHRFQSVIPPLDGHEQAGRTGQTAGKYSGDARGRVQQDAIAGFRQESGDLSFEPHDLGFGNGSRVRSIDRQLQGILMIHGDDIEGAQWRTATPQSRNFTQSQRTQDASLSEGLDQIQSDGINRFIAAVQFVLFGVRQWIQKTSIVQ